jgi:hypothetical protein
MSTRLEIELTSSRPDGTWTWRKAGAKLPKGVLEGALLPSGAKAGDVLRAEADITIDGVDILSIHAPKGERTERHQRLEVVGVQRDEPLVTTQLAPKGKGSDRNRGDRRDRGDRGDRGGRGDRENRPRREGGGREGGGREGGSREGGRDRGGRNDGGPRGDGAPRREFSRPKPKRLRPGRAHRNAVLETLAPEQRPIAEQVLRGGVPAVRQAVERQNALNKEQGMPEIHGDDLVALAEGLLPRLRAAEWRDKADNALAVLQELDLRDLRSVVVAADTGARDDESRSIAQTLRDGLAARVDQEHRSWLDELVQTLNEGRIVRALRLSSRPPKAGSPLPPEVTTRLVDLSMENLTPETTSDRWATMLDALAFSPIRTAVTPTATPENVSDELKAALSKFASRLPHIAQLFGIDSGAAPRRKASPPKPPAPKAPAPKAPAAPAKDAPAAEEAPAAEAPAAEAPAAEAPAAEAPAAETPAAEAPAAEQAPAENVEVVEAAEAPEAEVAEAAEAEAEPAVETATDALPE